MRLGVFGGSFDPVHIGHLVLAEACRDQARLDQVWFLPAAVAPHKQAREAMPARHRLAMLELALAGHAAMIVSALETDRGGVSYTVDTLHEIRSREPAAELFLLMGADSLPELPSWHRAAEICELALPLVIRRPGAPEPDFGVLAELVGGERLDEIRSQQIEAPQIGVSSSDIRQRVSQGRSIRYCVPRAVEKYIEANGLYRDESVKLG